MSYRDEIVTVERAVGYTDLPRFVKGRTFTPDRIWQNGLARPYEAGSGQPKIGDIIVEIHDEKRHDGGTGWHVLVPAGEDQDSAIRILGGKKTYMVTPRGLTEVTK